MSEQSNPSEPRLCNYCLVCGCPAPYPEFRTYPPLCDCWMHVTLVLHRGDGAVKVLPTIMSPAPGRVLQTTGGMWQGRPDFPLITFVLSRRGKRTLVYEEVLT